MRLILIFIFMAVMTITILPLAGCTSVGEVGEEVIEKITTNPMDPDGVLEKPLWPKKDGVDPATEPENFQSSNNLDEVIGNGLISILVWHHDWEPPQIMIAANRPTSRRPIFLCTIFKIVRTAFAAAGGEMRSD